MYRFMQKLLEADNGSNPAGNNGAPAPTTPPAPGPQANPQGASNGNTPPGSGGQGDPKTPDKSGQANGKLDPKNPFAGMHPNRVRAMRAALEEELVPKVQSRIQEEADAAAGKLTTKLSRLEAENTTLKPRVTELEGILERYQGLVNKYLDDRMKDWPKDWQSGDPRTKNPDAPLEDVIAWMDWAEPLVKRQGTTPPSPGNPGNPGSMGSIPVETPEQRAAYIAKVEREKGIYL